MGSGRVITNVSGSDDVTCRTMYRGTCVQVLKETSYMDLLLDHQDPIHVGVEIHIIF